jgi:xanthine dehydrogenase accessory factor
MSVLSLQRKPQHGPIDVARCWLDEFGRVMLATVVSTWGSSPVPVGGQLVVAPRKRFEGSVSGSCVEVDVISEAADIMATGRCKFLEFGIADETAWQSALRAKSIFHVFRV